MRSHCLIYFSFQCYSIPGGVDIDFSDISNTFIAELKKRAAGDSTAGELLIEKLPDSFNFYDTSDPSDPGLQQLNENREEIKEYIETITDNIWYCEALDTPCIYNLVGKQFCTPK